jgi:hypothetical protein
VATVLNAMVALVHVLKKQSLNLEKEKDTYLIWMLARVVPSAMNNALVTP